MPINTVFAIRREFDDSGNIREQFHTLEEHTENWPIFIEFEEDKDGP